MQDGKVGCVSRNRAVRLLDCYTKWTARITTYLDLCTRL